MGKIVLLDDLTINQIAAGEVIERPASAVKELVENSIDAGAKNISIDIKNGGISYIRITDDGSGILKDDMEIAFERHATSKIRKADDLDTVKSMGFRGEALASIAAIAKVEMTSKALGQENGYTICLEGGNITDQHEDGCAQGTSITIRELFYNTPVRYKFLKKDFTETGYIEETIQRIALANPSVAIKLVDTGKVTLQTTGNGKLEDAIYAVFGKEITENVLPVDYSYEDLHINGVIGKPIISRSNRTNQLFYVNHRFIKDKTLTSAAEQGFKGLVTIGKHGFLILNIDMDPKKVDVNVHPTKLEVRFEEESKVFKAVYHAIKETLLKSDLISSPDKDYSELTPNDILRDIRNNSITNNARIKAWGIQKAEEPSSSSKIIEKENPKENEESIKEKEELNEDFVDAQDIIKEDIAKHVQEMNKIDNVTPLKNSLDTDKLEVSADKENIDNVKENVEENVEEEENNEISNQNSSEENVTTNKNISEENQVSNISGIEEKEPSFEEMYHKLFGRDIEDAKKEYEEKLKEDEEKYPIQPISNNEVSMFEKEGVDKNPPYQFVGIAFKTYIILTIKDELYILDQHAAHERIMYEKVKENYYSKTDKDSQLMLIPDIINLNNKEMGIFRDNKEMFNEAGFIVDEFGENTVKLTGVPEFCLEFDTKEIFLETLDEIDTVARTAKQEIEDKFLATVACKAAVKAHMALSKEEVDSLMKQLLRLPNPFSCPHGRPTVIKMTKNDIEKKFSRR